MTGFKDVVGRKDLVSYIQKAITQNQISHAYILNGERGSGKKMFAQLFAMTLQCERGGAEPCNECHSCRQAIWKSSGYYQGGSRKAEYDQRG